MNPRLLAVILIIAAGLFAAVVGGCGYPKHIDPLLLTYPTKDLARLSAEARAKDIGGLVYLVANTHSMEPVLMGGDYIVVDRRITFDQVRLGQIVNYQAEFAPAPAPTVSHRAVVRDGSGLLASGDNVRPDIDPRTGQDLHSESRYRVTPSTYVGVVDTIYRVKP